MVCGSPEPAPKGTPTGYTARDGEVQGLMDVTKGSREPDGERRGVAGGREIVEKRRGLVEDGRTEQSA